MNAGQSKQQRADRILGRLLAVAWLAAVAVTLLICRGKSPASVWVVLFLGGMLAALPVYLVLKRSARAYQALQEENAEHKRSEMSALAFSKLGHHLSTATTAREAFEHIKEISNELFGWDACWLNLYNAQIDSLYSGFSVDTVNGKQVEFEELAPRKPTELYRRIMEQGSQLILRDKPTAPVPGTQAYGDVSRPSASLMFVPLRSRGRAVGLLSVQSYTPRAYTEQDLKTLQIMADQCGGAFERIWAEEARHKSETQFRLVWNASTDGMRLANRDGTVIMVNEAYCRMVGKAKAELEGQPFSIIHHEERAERILRRQIERVDANTIPAYLETEVTLWDGRKVWFELSNSILQLPGQPSLVLSIFRDITERKRVEGHLFQSQKMETVGKLAGGIAHEFNSIMTAIIGQSELLLTDLPPGNPLAKNATEILTAAERAATLTRQLLAYGRKQMLRPEILDLNAVLARMENMFQHLMGRNAEVRFRPAAGCKNVKVDAGQIEQVIVNIVMNAADAMPHGGRLTLETSTVTLDAEYVRSYPDLKAGEYVMLAIGDTGAGMSEEIKARVFEPFFTTKDIGKGTGLGLATCHGIIKQSGGHITVYSELGRGTTFKIYLPRAEAEAAKAAPPRNASDLPSGTETVLLVEDDSSLREMAATLLQRLGYNVIAVADGIEAMGIAHKKDRGHIDLLFTDVVMPHMSGKELAERVQAIYPHTRILFTSAYTESAISHQGALLPGVELLEKPFTPSTLARKVRDVLDKKKA